MSDVKRYTDYGGMIDCETQELVGGPGTYVKASDYVELRKQLEQLSDKYNTVECTADAWKIRAEKAEARCKQPFVHVHNGECWISEFDEHGTIRPIMGPFMGCKDLALALEATSPVSPTATAKTEE